MTENISNAINQYEVFGHKYNIPFVSDAHDTKNKILFESAKLFAIQGYSAVSVRDIADCVGITPGAFYNHFISKELLLDTILELGRDLHLKYFKHLDEHLAVAKNFSDVIDFMFVEPIKMENIYTNYVYTLAITESTRHALSVDIFMNTILRDGTELMKKWLDTCVSRGWMKECDTMTVSLTITHNIIIAIIMKIQTEIDNVPPYDFREMLIALKENIKKNYSLN